MQRSANSRRIIRVDNLRHQPDDYLGRTRPIGVQTGRIGASSDRATPPTVGVPTALVPPLSKFGIFLQLPGMPFTLAFTPAFVDANRMDTELLTGNIVAIRTKRPTTILATGQLLRHVQHLLWFPPTQGHRVHALNTEGKNMRRKRKNILYPGSLEENAGRRAGGKKRGKQRRRCLE